MTLSAKVCTACKVSLPAEAFYRRSNRPAGISAECRACSVKRTMAWKARPESAEKVRAAQRRWQATEAGKATKARHDRSEHKRQKVAEYAQTEMGRASNQRYSASPKGRARRDRYFARRRMASAAPSTLTAEQWQAIQVMQAGLCAYCNQPSKLTMDHVIPLSRGGAHTLENVVGACKPCNSRKRDRLISPSFRSGTSAAVSMVSRECQAVRRNGRCGVWPDGI